MKDCKEKGRSIIAFPDEYVVLDIETTGLDFEYDEIIEVAALKIKNDEVIGSFNSLIKPDNSHVLFTVKMALDMGYDDSKVPYEIIKEYCSTHLIPEEIIELTGITNEMLFEAPSSDKVIPQFLDFIGLFPIIGHNIYFDVNFLVNIAENYQLKVPNDIIDTLRISRKLYPEMQHHRLIDMVEKLEVNQDIRHRAFTDAEATFECYLKMKKEIISNEGIEMFQKRFLKTFSYNLSLKNMQAQTTEIDDTNPIFGKVVVFTGELSSMKRKDAFQIVLNLGGIPKNSITKETNILVVGKEEFVASVKNGKTIKMQKANAYAKKGMDIITLSEDTFFSMIQDFIE